MSRVSPIRSDESRAVRCFLYGEIRVKLAEEPAGPGAHRAAAALFEAVDYHEEPLAKGGVAAHENGREVIVRFLTV